MAGLTIRFQSQLSSEVLSNISRITNAWKWWVFFLRVWLQCRVEKFFSSRNEDCIMQNCPFYISPNLLGVAANRQHSAGRFPSSGWHRRARAVGQSHGTMSDEMVPKPSSVPRSLSLFPSPLCFSLILSFSWILHFKWKVPLFSAWKSGCRLKDIFFPPSSRWENEPVSGISRHSAFTAFFYESRYSMWVPVLNISI